jgi:pSer/pThr/pTyr-binding forkhead associated (FHA) protein
MRNPLPPPALPAANPARAGRALSPPLRRALAGAAGGFLVFLLLELNGRAADLSGARSGDYDAWRGSAFLLGTTFGGIVTAALAAGEEWHSGSALRVGGRALLGALVGAVLAAGYSLIGNAFFAVLDGGGLARLVAWGLFGLGVGLSAGIVSRSPRRAYLGCLGGLLGGLLGGALFDPLAVIGGGGEFGRMAGYVVLAACVGAATALVERWTRVAWLTFHTRHTGSREGQEVVLHLEDSVLGRDELADVPLFGDPAVARRHALLSLSPVPHIRELEETGLLRVEGHPVTQAALYDGALVEIGRHRFRFRHREVSAASPAYSAAERMVHAPWTSLPSRPPGPEGEVTLLPEPAPEPLPRPTIPEGRVALWVAAGPAAGRVVLLGQEEITLGRERDNTIALADPRVSRRHARIVPVEGTWLLEDLESRNGVRLNGLRVTRAGLAPGDRIYLGETILSVEAGTSGAGADPSAGQAYMPTSAGWPDEQASGGAGNTSAPGGVSMRHIAPMWRQPPQE